EREESSCPWYTRVLKEVLCPRHRNLSRVQQASDRSGGGSGTQGGSGPTPLSFELRSAVVGPAVSCFRRGNGKICVCQRRADLRPEVSSNHPGSPARPAGVYRPN